MREPGPQLIDRLAAEYVLGTLRGRARDRFERWRRTRPEVASAVRAWEDRLVALLAGTRRVAPSPRVWRELELRLGLRGVRPVAPRVPASWLRALAAGVAVLGLGVATFLLLREPALEWRPAAVLAAQGAATTAWRVEVDADGTRLRAVAVAPLPAGTAQAYELWALPPGEGRPVSLGLLPRAGSADRELSAVQRVALAQAANLAVSREPASGSPTGLPTGEVVIVAPRLPPA